MFINRVTSDMNQELGNKLEIAIVNTVPKTIAGKNEEYRLSIVETDFASIFLTNKRYNKVKVQKKYRLEH